MRTREWERGQKKKEGTEERLGGEENEEKRGERERGRKREREERAGRYKP
jgi:hypothetical protein